MLFVSTDQQVVMESKLRGGPEVGLGLDWLGMVWMGVCGSWDVLGWL